MIDLVAFVVASRIPAQRPANATDLTMMASLREQLTGFRRTRQRVLGGLHTNCSCIAHCERSRCPMSPISSLPLRPEDVWACDRGHVRFGCQEIPCLLNTGYSWSDQCGWGGSSVPDLKQELVPSSWQFKDSDCDAVEVPYSIRPTAPAVMRRPLGAPTLPSGRFIVPVSHGCTSRAVVIS